MKEREGDRSTWESGKGTKDKRKEGRVQRARTLASRTDTLRLVPAILSVEDRTDSQSCVLTFTGEHERGVRLFTSKNGLGTAESISGLMHM